MTSFLGEGLHGDHSQGAPELPQPCLISIMSANAFNLKGITFGPRAASTLKRLDLSSNHLKGTVPKGLSSLKRLESLSLSITSADRPRAPVLVGNTHPQRA